MLTHKVYFDVEIGGKPTGNALFHYISFCKRKRLALLEKKRAFYFDIEEVFCQFHARIG